MWVTKLTISLDFVTLRGYLGWMDAYRATLKEAPKAVNRIKLTYVMDTGEKFIEEFQDRPARNEYFQDVKAFDQVVEALRHLNELGFLNTPKGWYPISRIKFIKKETFTA